MRKLTKRSRILAISCAVFVLLPLTARADPTEEKARKRPVSAPRPAYPYEARQQGWTGSGIVVVDVNVKTGLVVGARMLKSTGHAILDHSAICAFCRWHFRPGTTAKQVKIPIAFTRQLPAPTKR